MELNELLSDEAFVSDVIALDSVEKIYEISERYDYSGTIEDLKKEILDLIFSLQDEESESVVAGVRNNKKNIIASTLAGVTLFGTITPNLYAETEATRNESLERSTNLNAKLDSFSLNFADRKTLKKIGLGNLCVATLGALLVGGHRYLNNRKIDNCANNSEKMGNAQNIRTVKPKINTAEPAVQDEDNETLKRELGVEILTLQQHAKNLNLNLLETKQEKQNKKEMESATKKIVKILTTRLTNLYSDLCIRGYKLPRELQNVEYHDDYFRVDAIFAVYVELYTMGRYVLSWCDWFYREGRKQNIECGELIYYESKVAELIVKFFKDSIDKYDDLYENTISKSYSELRRSLKKIREMQDKLN